MPYYPGFEFKEKFDGLAQGFMVGMDPKLVLCIKLEPSLINSIIKGCLIELVIIKAALRERSILLLVEDIPGQPFFAVGEKFTDESNEFVGYDTIIKNLLESDEIILGLFNLNSQPVYSRVLKLNPENKLEEFKKWIDQPTSLIGDPMHLLKDDVFILNINNLDNTGAKDISFINLKPHSNYSSESLPFTPIVSTDNVTDDGKHGYNQEESIRNLLLDFWRNNEQLFISPERENGNELIDFIILLPNAIILIESKYIISAKRNKKTRAIRKAIEQLKLAEKYLKVKKQFKQVDLSGHTFVQICLVDIKMFNLLKEFKIELEEEFTAPLLYTMTSFTSLIAEVAINDLDNFESIFESQLLKLWNGRNQKHLKIS